MAWQQPTKIVLPTAPRSVSPATLGGPSTTLGRSAFVRGYVFRLKSKQRKWSMRVCFDSEQMTVHTCSCFHSAANVCTCKNGVAQTGEGCPVDAMAKCQSCHIGWTLNHAKTDCIRTWLHLRSPKCSNAACKLACVVIPQQIVVRARMAWRKRGRLVLWAVK